MKTIHPLQPLVLGLAALALCSAPARADDKSATPDAPATAAPAPTDKEAAKAARKAEHDKKMLEKYDANHDGQLEPEEKGQMKADRKAEHDKRMLAKYDANHNGKLDPEELARMEADKQAKKEKHQAAKEAKQAAAGEAAKQTAEQK